MSRCRILCFLALLLAACGGDGGDRPTSSEPPSGTTPQEESSPTPPPQEGGTEVPEQTETEPPPSSPPGEASQEILVEVAANLRSPRDLVFGPLGSPYADELFAVNFVGVEAVWIKNLETEAQVAQPIQNSLAGAIAGEMDGAGRFFFACATPTMGGNQGVITVRTVAGQVEDFQYAGVSTPTGVALDKAGRLYVANRSSNSITRLDFSDGARPDNHQFKVIAENLSFATAGLLPNHLLVDPAGRLFLCETGGNRVRTWTEEEGLRIFAGPDQGLNQPVGIARLGNGHILVTNHGDGSIVELDEQGFPLERIDTGLGQGQLYGIAVRSDSRIYVAAGDGRGQVYRLNR